MSLIVKIVISVAVAAVATALTTWLAGDSPAAPVMFIAFCAATVATVLLVSFTPGSAAAAPGEAAGKTRRPPRPAAGGPGSGDAATAAGPREQGTVKWFNVSKGFGFITKDDGEEIFVHFRSIRGGGRRGLKDGQRVSFSTTQSSKGPQAEDVEGL